MKKTITLLLCFTFTVIHAQQAILTSGGDATGAGGSASYSVGQMVYGTATGSNGSEAQGVQQAFEISTTLGVEDNLINLSFIAYPNPTTNVLTLKVANFNQNKMEYALFDIQGRLLKKQKIQQENTNITTENMASAIYFLRIFHQKNLVKIFKIIKK